MIFKGGERGKKEGTNRALKGAAKREKRGVCAFYFIISMELGSCRGFETDTEGRARLEEERFRVYRLGTSFEKTK